MKILTGFCAVLLMFSAGALMAADNQLTQEEKQAGWKLLFNGKDHAGWKCNTGKPIATPVEDGCLVPYKSGGYIVIYEKPYGDFVLSCDVRWEDPRCNSGIFFRVENPKNPVNTGFEIQVMAGEKTGKHEFGAIYDLVPTTKNPTKGTGRMEPRRNPLPRPAHRRQSQRRRSLQNERRRIRPARPLPRRPKTQIQAERQAPHGERLRPHRLPRLPRPRPQGVVQKHQTAGTQIAGRDFARPKITWQNPKSESRNPKQSPMTKCSNSKPMGAAAFPDEGKPAGVGALEFGILNLFRILDFVLRISIKERTELHTVLGRTGRIWVHSLLCSQTFPL